MPLNDKTKPQGYIAKARKLTSDNPEIVTIIAGAGLVVAGALSRRRFTPATATRLASIKKHYPYKIALMNAQTLRPTVYTDPYMQGQGAKSRYVTSPANLSATSRYILDTVTNTRLPISQLDIIYTDTMQRSASVASINTGQGLAAILQVTAPLATGSDAMTRALLGHQLKHEFLGHVANGDYQTSMLLHGATLLPVIYGATSLATHMPSSALFVTGSLIARQAALNSWNRYIERRADKAAIEASTDDELIAAHQEFEKYAAGEKKRESIDALIQSERTGLAATKPYQQARRGVKTLFQEYPTATSRAKQVEKELRRRQSNARRDVMQTRKARDMQCHHRAKAIAAPKHHRGKSSSFRPR